MKQRLFVALLSLLPALVSAQQGKDFSKDWNFEIGPSIAHPIHYLGMFSQFGVGLDAAATHPLPVKGLAVGARVSYQYFFGRSADPAFTSGNGDHYKHSNIWDAMGEVNYTLPQKIRLGVDLGFGDLTFNGAGDPSFAQKFYAGYQWDNKMHPLIFALFYEQTVYHKNVGLRATVLF